MLAKMVTGRVPAQEPTLADSRLPHRPRGCILWGMPTPADIGSLRDALERGETFEVILFPDCGQATTPPTASCLSQWATTPFSEGGLGFHSAEQAMMHGKALLFGDARTAERILRARTPFQARELGFQVLGFQEEIWKARRLEVVVSANLPKFRSHPDLAAFLLGTGNAVLAEASPTDLVWGTGIDALSPHARDPRRWTGLSLLGFALMEVRDRLRASAPGGATTPEPPSSSDGIRLHGRIPGEPPRSGSDAA